eukprot:scaffold139125_cov16-Prasinocladus_malaysianus.AAC.1
MMHSEVRTAMACGDWQVTVGPILCQCNDTVDCTLLFALFVSIAISMSAAHTAKLYRCVPITCGLSIPASLLRVRVRVPFLNLYDYSYRALPSIIIAMVRYGSSASSVVTPSLGLPSDWKHRQPKLSS